MRTVTLHDATYTLKTGRSSSLERRYPCGSTIEIKIPSGDVPYLLSCSAPYIEAYFIMSILEETKRKTNAKKNEEKIN